MEKKEKVVLIKNAIVREKGYLYYIDGEGSVCRAEMHRNPKKENE